MAPESDDQEAGALDTVLGLALLGGMGYGGYRVVQHYRGGGDPTGE